jgi:hypothetical protein
MQCPGLPRAARSRLSYDVEPGISIGDLKRAYRYDRKGYERLQQHRLRILQEGWPYPEWG